MLIGRYTEAGVGLRHFECAEGTTYVIGRHPSADIVVQDGRVSSQHGEFSYRDGRWWYRDLRSTNGSLLLAGDERTIVDGRTTVDVYLADGNTLVLGDVDDPVVVSLQVISMPDAPAVDGTILARVDSQLDAVIDTALANMDPANILQLLRDVSGARDVLDLFACVSEWIGSALLEYLSRPV